MDKFYSKAASAEIDLDESAGCEPENRLADAKRQGQAQFDSILEMVEALRAAEEAIQKTRDGLGGPGTYDAAEKARQAIEEDALSVEVRSGWYNPCTPNGKPEWHMRNSRPEEYRILLCTGGPACQIVGELNEHCEPVTARMQVQDWFQPWTDYRPIADKAVNAKDPNSGYDSESVLLDYARCFWFGE